ncbi:MazG-like family protein [Micromonospora antibiotica]|uniref:MazG-like family protein n=1 Tax=Micromonospora antibiotica TaxID=2807623 RepID=UPI001FCA41FD|nr:MazG-like family protein [Micromonospora antibiotica]
MNPTAADSGVFDVAALVATRLDAINGRSREEAGLRILKVTEEAGEAAAAWIGTIGQNPRKGITHTTADVADELADVVLTALVAIASIDHDPQQVIGACVDKVTARLDHTYPRPTPPADIDSTVVDPVMVAHYGDLLHEAAHGVDCDCRPQVRRQFTRYVEALLCWLTRDGRLTGPNRAG